MCLKCRINYYNYQPGSNIVNVDNYFKHITHTHIVVIINTIIIREDTPISLLRKSSRSRRLWESPPVPTERYERRPCLCVFVARFDRRIFTIRQKRIRGGVRSPKVTASHLLMARPCHCLSATHGWALPTQYPL